MILQRIRIIVGDAGLGPGTSASEVWCATNDYFFSRLLLTIKQQMNKSGVAPVVRS